MSDCPPGCRVNFNKNYPVISSIIHKVRGPDLNSFLAKSVLFASLYLSTKRVRSFFHNVVCKFYNTKDPMII